MNSATTDDRDVFLENLAAELTDAAYPVVLRHGVGYKWLDLELDLWKAMTETVKKLEGVDGECVPTRGAHPRPSAFFR